MMACQTNSDRGGKHIISPSNKMLLLSVRYRILSALCLLMLPPDRYAHGLSCDSLSCSEKLKRWKEAKQRELMKMQARVGQWESVGGDEIPSASRTSRIETTATDTKNAAHTGLASWETSTKGFGSRMLQRMGLSHHVSISIRFLCLSDEIVTECLACAHHCSPLLSLSRLCA